MPMRETTVVGIALSMLIIGCSSGSPMTSDASDSPSISDAGAPSDGGDIVVVVDAGNPSDAAASGVTSIDISPLELVPPFSPTIHDYAVRCAAGTNTVTLAVQDELGVKTVGLDLFEDHALVVEGDYHIRCLPHDFPVLAAVRQADAGAPTPGWYLLGTTTIAAGYAGFAMVLDTNGTPIWYQRAGTVQDVESFAIDTLSFMPSATAPFGIDTTASFNVLSLDAKSTTNLTASAGLATDGHELRFLPNGDHLVLTYPIETSVDLTGLSTYGANETIADCEVQEIDPSGNLVWSWLASDHIDAVQESLEPTPFTIGAQTVIDVFHCNSIDVDASGNLLVSSRHMNSVFYIDKTTSKILWKLGGASYNKDGAQYIQIVGDDEVAFNMQHDARFEAGGNVSVFDDHGANTLEHSVARAVEYAIDHTLNRATIAWEYKGINQSLYMGSFRRYADGENVIGWGGASPDLRTLTEVNASGADVLDVALGKGNVSYRAVKAPLAQFDIDVLRASVIPAD